MAGKAAGAHRATRRRHEESARIALTYGEEPRAASSASPAGFDGREFHVHVPAADSEGGRVPAHDGRGARVPADGTTGEEHGPG